MEGIIYRRVPPLIKCVVLLLFIFTAKVLTSRPQDVQKEGNSVHYQKPSLHYMRTFTKSHHKRIQWNNMKYDSIQDHPKVIQKRSVEQNSNEFITDDVPNEFAPNINIDHEKPAISVGKESQSTKNGLPSPKLKKEKIIEPAPMITCVFKPMPTTSTPSYADEGDQQVVENESFNRGVVIDGVVEGQPVKLEICSDSQAYCFTVLEDDSKGNSTVIGQGCWHASQTERRDCGTCRRQLYQASTSTSVKFCCCTTTNCNADYASLQEETVTMAAESPSPAPVTHQYGLAVGIAALLVSCAAAAVLRRWYCRPAAQPDTEKGDVMGSGPDALATGLLCVDNLTLIEHIGQGKFGSVWRGSLGSTPVAVKLYTNASAWQKEAAIYALPHLAHPNILRYYGSDTRATLTLSGARQHLIVVEWCAETLRARLQRDTLAWAEFARIAHGMAAALAHLHTPTGSKPCVVHRDVNSNNVLVTAAGDAKLADLGLAQTLRPRGHHPPPTTITEAGTLRYLSPEALEGALDLSGARAALCAVDVFALALTAWECLWRTAAAHAGPAPPYSPPYRHHGLPDRPSLQQMQSVVSRNKLRPPLPRGAAGGDARALRLACDTCDECWDHDAEARLTAVCVEERMRELRAILRAPLPNIHDNNLHTEPHIHDTNSSPPESDKNSNCTAAQVCDITTPLLYPHPHMGDNLCIERNTYTAEPTTVELLHRSTKDIPANPPENQPRVQNIEENCLSVARTSYTRPMAEYENADRLNEIRSYQRPLLDYVQNDVSSHEDKKPPKQTNLQQHNVKIEKPKRRIRNFFERKLGRNPRLETEVKLVPELNQTQNKTKTSLVNEKPCNFDRPANLVINHDRTFDFEVPCTLSPPNRTLSPTMMMESDLHRENKVFGFRELPREETEPKNQNQIFAVIVPKGKPSERKKGSTDSINKSIRTSMSSQSIFRSGHSESEDSTIKKRLSCDNRIITNNSSSGRSSRASINLELQYINQENFNNDSPYDLNSDCSSSEDEHLMLLSENGGSKITMQTIPKSEPEKKRFQNEVLKESSQTKTDFVFNKYQNKYSNFDNEFSDPNDKENLVYSGDNPLYLAALNGEIETDGKYLPESDRSSPKPPLKKLTIKRQHSLEQVSELFSSSGDVNLLNPAGRVKTPGDLPVAIRKARRDRALQKGRASESNRLSLYDDRMMFGNSL